jgi:hypothetical protein
MTYLDGNSDRIAQWEDLQPEEMPAAARAMLESGKYLTRVNGLWHKLEAQDRTQMKLVLIAEAKWQHFARLSDLRKPEPFRSSKQPKNPRHTPICRTWHG